MRVSSTSKVCLAADDQSDEHTISFLISPFAGAAPTPNWTDYAVAISVLFSSRAALIHLKFDHRSAMNPKCPHEHIAYWHFSLIDEFSVFHGHLVRLILVYLIPVLVAIVNY